MKKCHIFLFVTYCSLINSVSFGQFTSIADDFSSASALTGSTPDSGLGVWQNSTGTSGAISTTGGSAKLLTSSNESTQLNFASSDLTTGTYYLGFDFSVSATGTINTNDTIQSIAGFRIGTASSGSIVASFGVFRPSGNAQSFSGSPNTTTSQFVAGIFTGTSLNATTDSLTEWAAPLSRGTTYRAVLGLNLDTDRLDLWINPISVTSTYIELPGLTANARAVFLRAGNSSTGDIDLDNLIVSQNFSTAAAIPEPATFTFCTALAAAASLAFRRQNPAWLRTS
jgi:hypothetical protein